jgi:hypothetical protein
MPSALNVYLFVLNDTLAYYSANFILAPHKLVYEIYNNLCKQLIYCDCKTKCLLCILLHAT